MKPTDPQFSLLAAPGFQGVNPSITAGGRPFQEGGGANMMDGHITWDPSRTGWYPPLVGGTTSTSEFFRVDLGVSPAPTHLWMVKSVKIMGAASTTYYMPTTVYAQLSSDGVTWSTNMPMGVVNGVFVAPGINQLARYVNVLCAPYGSYWLAHELAVGAYAISPPRGVMITTRGDVRGGTGS